VHTTSLQRQDFGSFAEARSVTSNQTPPQSEPPALRITRQNADEILAEREEAGQALLESSEAVAGGTSQASWGVNFVQWCRVTQDALRHIYTTKEVYEEFRRKTSRIRRKAHQSDDKTFANQCEAVSKGVGLLTALRAGLAYVDDPAESTGADAAEARTFSRRVFVVHGRNEGLRDRVALRLERLDFDTVILEDKPSEGLRTLREKIEKYADVGFAVVITSPDDYGRGPDDNDWPSEPDRARQNVLFELGYFAGRLGRDRVVLLHDERVAFPSDLGGVAYVGLDAGGAWKLKLAKERKRPSTTSTSTASEPSAARFAASQQGKQLQFLGGPARGSNSRRPAERFPASPPGCSGRNSASCAA
jgi:predicted nucleotide-binding protein